MDNIAKVEQTNNFWFTEVLVIPHDKDNTLPATWLINFLADNNEIMTRIKRSGSFIKVFFVPDGAAQKAADYINTRHKEINELLKAMEVEKMWSTKATIEHTPTGHKREIESKFLAKDESSAISKTYEIILNDKNKSIGENETIIFVAAKLLL